MGDLTYSQPSPEFLEAQKQPSTASLDYWMSSAPTAPFASDSYSGKWCIFVGRRSIDAAWARVDKAVRTGSLVHAKVSTAYNPSKTNHVICVYNRDWADFEDQIKTLKELRRLGFGKVLKYKRDVDTMHEVKRFAMYSKRGDDINFHRGYAKKFVEELGKRGIKV